jgi:hypothetical protein
MDCPAGAADTFTHSNHRYRTTPEVRVLRWGERLIMFPIVTGCKEDEMPGKAGLPAVKLTDVLEAFEFVSASEYAEHHAYVRRDDGSIVFVSEMLVLEENIELPDDPENAGYLAVPHRRDLDLGKRLALSFVTREMPDSLTDVRRMFSRRGAYRRFKHFLQINELREKWYAFEEISVREALKNWCEEVGLALADERTPGGSGPAGDDVS